VLSQTLLPKKPEGVIAAYEMMVVTPAIQNLIRENKTYRIDSTLQTGRKEGMFLLDESLFKLWKDQLCDKEECLLRASKPQELAAKIAQAERGIFEDEEGMEEDEDDYEDDHQRGTTASFRRPVSQGLPPPQLRFSIADFRRATSWSDIPARGRCAIPLVESTAPAGASG